MLKLGKGLKKKKKNKKGKKGEELFTAEELEQYKRDHAHKEEEAGPSDETKPAGNSEDYEKFKLLTAGVDDFLKKTQGDLDRIKKDSFFQRKPTPSEIKAQEEKEKAELQKSEGNWENFKSGALQVEEVDKGDESHFEDSGSEFEVDDTDDIFDTAYIDQLESGEIKLAYVPDDDEPGLNDGPDPFDTSTADELLRRAEEEERKKKKEISLGLAVNVLSGRAERDRALLEGNNIKEDDSKTSKVVRTRPRKIQDFCLLGSFDESGNKPEANTEVEHEPVANVLPKSILDEDLVIDEELPEGDSLISHILVNQVVKPPPPELATPDESYDTVQGIVSEFDICQATNLEIKKLEEEDEFDEFSALAASSVINQKLDEELKEFEAAEDDPFDTSVVDSVLRTEPDPFDSIESHTQHLPVEFPQAATREGWTEIEEAVEDPFDTTFADNCAPGKAEIRLLEKEILEAHIPNPTVRKADILLEARILSRNNSDDFNPREGEEKARSSQRVSIHITDPSGETQRGSESDDLVALSLNQRDLLGGSNTDLTSLVDQPIVPTTVSPSEELSRYSAQFDTSLADQVSLPGKVELKLIEEELLSDLRDPLQDFDFDPRADDDKAKGVSFDVPSPGVPDLLDSFKGEAGGRPLTPFYAEPLSAESDVDFEAEDPFDTSHVTHLPGKQELKLIERELEQITSLPTVTQTVHEKLGILPDEVSSGLKHSTSDQDFNPRAEEATLIARPPIPIKSNPCETDLFSLEEEITSKPLTPTVEANISSYLDPFDTSIAENIAPGKAEIKLLEAELVGTITRSYTDDDFNPRQSSASVIKAVLSSKPLIPLEATEPDDFDPFDTSIADNVGPGKAELRLLESEFVG